MAPIVLIMILKQALLGKKTERPPIWLMRQAGRYLPSYRTFKEKQSLFEMFHDPKTIVEVTKLPFESLDLDAAILFSDILTVLDGLGIPYTFDPGPKIQFSGFSKKEHAYGHIHKSIVKLKEQLTVPLLGFAGAPLTITSYLIEGETTKTFSKMKHFLFEKTTLFKDYLQRVTDETIGYLQLQVNAGVDAIQIFDSWANHLAPHEFENFSLPYLKQIVDAIQPQVPVILFARGMHVKALATLSPSAISVDWSYDLPLVAQTLDPQIVLQGNLDPCVLYSDHTTICKAVDRIVKPLKGRPGFIFNLGHGILPDTPFENVKYLVDYVRSQKI